MPHILVHNFLDSRYDVVGIATRYEMNSSGFEHWWGRNFPHSSRLAVDATQPPVLWTPGLFHRNKVAGVWH